MHISNIRLGHANNSSSSHSLIFLRPEQNITDNLEDGDFGWNHFTLVSSKAKKQYLAAQIFSNIRSIVKNRDYAIQITKSIVGGARFEVDEYGSVSPSIDHQSIYELPLDWKEEALHPEFIEEFKKYLLQKDIAILGGNDNDGAHPLGEGSFNLPLSRDGENKGLIARKDGEWWTLFNRRGGNKLRMSFNKNPNPYVKSTCPELVDLKITDFCPFDCAYCYQGSTAKGGHADIKLINSVIDLLEKMEVFEVAIGGGEPTMHPNFVKLLYTCQYHNVIPNFTTKSTKWLRDPVMLKAFTECCGSCAFSIEDAKDINMIGSLLNSLNLGKDRNIDGEYFHRRNRVPSISVQYVMGTGNWYNFKYMLEAARYWGFRMTLLGYKETGRGSQFKNNVEDYGKWLKTVKEVQKEGNLPSLAIDTALAASSEEELIKEGIAKEMFHTVEGKFSMYIDAVESTMGPSSYCEKKLMQGLPLSNCNGWVSDDVVESVIEVYKNF